MTEKTLTSNVLKILKGSGWYAIKIHGGPYQTPGLPDVLALKDGRLLAIELKTPSGKPSKLQVQRLLELRQHGAVAGIVHSIAELHEVLAAV